MTGDTTEVLIWALENARRHTLTLAGDIPQDRACQQSVTGEHHPVWILGHLLLGDTYLLSLLSVESLSAEFPILLERYGRGASPVALPDRYDALPTLVERLKLIGSRRRPAIGVAADPWPWPQAVGLRADLSRAPPSREADEAAHS